jgi:hypothetical protein
MPVQFTLASSCKLQQSVQSFVGPEFLTAAVMNAASLWDLAQCGPYFNRHFGETYQQPATRWFLVRLFFDHEDGGDIFFRNVCSRTDYTALCPITTAVRISSPTPYRFTRYVQAIVSLLFRTAEPRV